MAEAAILTDPNNPAQESQSTDGQKQSGDAGAAWDSELFGADGTINHKAFEKAPDEIKKSAKTFERYKTRGDFIKGSIERESLLGKKGFVQPPDPSAPEAEKAEYRNFVAKVNGAPEKPEGYGITKPKDLPDNMWNGEYASAAAAVAHKHGASPALLKDLVEVSSQFGVKAREAQAQAEKEWFDGQDRLYRDTLAKDGLDFAKGKELADRAARRWGVSPENPVMKNATVLTLLTRIGKAGLEDTIVRGDTNELGLAKEMSLEAAQKAMDDMVHNKDNPMYKAFWDRNHADNAKARAQYEHFSRIVAEKKTPRMR